MLILGAVLGIVFGAIPGLTATMGLALLVPFTFSMDPAAGLLMLAGIYIGAMYGDAIPAILINTPGTPAAIATTFDGYPLAKKGMAQHALVAAALASCFGSLLANTVLATSAERLAQWSLKFGPPEYFWLGIFGLTLIALLSAEDLLKGLLTASVGLVLSTVGMATLAGDVRLTFGFPELQGGIGLAGALIGFFCLPEILGNLVGRDRVLGPAHASGPSLAPIRETSAELIGQPILMLRSSLIGLVVGVAPGAGGNVASMVAYSEARRWDRKGDEYGKGTVRGVAASEAANSAMAPGSLVPLLTLGIPGSPPAAVILGALMLHGMQPGHELFASYGSIIYAFIFGLAIASIVVLIFGILGSFVYARIVNVPTRWLVPIVLMMSVLGSYAIRNNFLDVWIMLVFGIVGIVLTRLGHHPAPLVLGLILGPYVEDGLVQSMMLGGAAGNVLTYMVFRPISIVLIMLCVVSVCWPYVSHWRGRGAAVPRSAALHEDDPRPNGVNGDLFIGIVLLALALVVLVNSRDLSKFGGLFVHFSVGAVILFSVITIFLSQLRPSRRRVFSSMLERRRIFSMVLVFGAYLVALPILGFLLASVLFFVGASLILSDGPFRLKQGARAVGSAIAVTAVLYLLFVQVLRVPLPLFGLS